jgi:hypothetical protein
MEPNHIDLRGPLPAPDGKPAPCFFGREVLNNRQLVAGCRFAPALELGRKILLGDASELQGLIERLPAERLQLRKPINVEPPVACMDQGLNSIAATSCTKSAASLKVTPKWRCCLALTE